MTQTCPFNNGSLSLNCVEVKCALWCAGEHCCSFKAIALQLIKIEEKEVK